MAGALTELSNTLAATVEKAGKSVVRVDARPRLPATGIVWSPDGVIVTAHHVVERDEGITIGLAGGAEAEATLAGRDPTTDVAVLRARASGLIAPAWADVEAVRVGHLALALGRPGKTALATMGIVSALGEGWRTPAGGWMARYLQTDVAMLPGFSGGPLVDGEGRVIGMNTSGMLRAISVVVPAPTLKQVVETLLAHGKVRRGYLGIGAQPVRLSEALARQLGQETGLLLASVESGAAAERAGLLQGDIIVALDGQPVRHLDDLLALLSGDRIGKAVPVRIIRGGQPREVRATVGERG